MSLNGIDVSGWQKGINLSAVPADFVIIKATGGTSYVSSDCDRQYQQAKRAGKLVGVYHFANDDNRASSAETEADFFVANTLGYHDGATLLVLDFEAQALPLGPGWALAFMRRVEQKTGIKPMLYLMGSEAAQPKWDPVVREDFGLWLAHWTVSGRTGYVKPPAPMVTRWPFAAIHQYSEQGRLPGYDDNLDLNIAHIDKAAWMKYAAKNGAVKPVPPVVKPPVVIPPAGKTYTVKSGDALSLIAEHHGVTTSALATANGISNPDLIYPGQILRIPGGSSKKTYTVQRGDTLSGIAAKFGTTWQELQRVNGIANPNMIYSGQVLTIP